MNCIICEKDITDTPYITVTIAQCEGWDKGKTEGGPVLWLPKEESWNIASVCSEECLVKWVTWGRKKEQELLNEEWRDVIISRPDEDEEKKKRED